MINIDTEKAIKVLSPWFHYFEIDGIPTKRESILGEPLTHPRMKWEAIRRGLDKHGNRKIHRNKSAKAKK